MYNKPWHHILYNLCDITKNDASYFYPVYVVIFVFFTAYFCYSSPQKARGLREVGHLRGFFPIFPQPQHQSGRRQFSTPNTRGRIIMIFSHGLCKPSCPCLAHGPDKSFWPGPTFLWEDTYWIVLHYTISYYELLHYIITLNIKKHPIEFRIFLTHDFTMHRHVFIQIWDDAFTCQKHFWVLFSPNLALRHIPWPPRPNAWITHWFEAH